nr:ABC transporter ATP-binding protein [uncultured Acetatifactor sp.]
MNRYPEHHYAHPQPPLLSVQSVEKYYGSPQSVTKALDQVSFRIRPGEHIAVMGASGSGKTTLLNCISTIDTVSSGHILLEGRDITAIPMEEIAAFRREALGFVFQEFNLLDTLTLEENMALPLTIRELEPAEIRAKVHALADRLGLSEALGKFPYQVSGGQNQRCAFARAVIGGPKLILADEPTGALDSASARILLEIMHRFHRESHTTILMVTHDAFSASFAERILFLKDGRIFNEILKGEKERDAFYHEILDVLSVLGGERPC